MSNSRLASGQKSSGSPQSRFSIPSANRGSLLQRPSSIQSVSPSSRSSVTSQQQLSNRTMAFTQLQKHKHPSSSHVQTIKQPHTAATTKGSEQDVKQQQHIIQLGTSNGIRNSAMRIINASANGGSSNIYSSDRMKTSATSQSLGEYQSLSKGGLTANQLLNNVNNSTTSISSAICTINLCEETNATAIRSIRAAASSCPNASQVLSPLNNSSSTASSSTATAPPAASPYLSKPTGQVKVIYQPTGGGVQQERAPSASSTPALSKNSSNYQVYFKQGTRPSSVATPTISNSSGQLKSPSALSLGNPLNNNGSINTVAQLLQSVQTQSYNRFRRDIFPYPASDEVNQQLTNTDNPPPPTSEGLSEEGSNNNLNGTASTNYISERSMITNKRQLSPSSNFVTSSIIQPSQAKKDIQISTEYSVKLTNSSSSSSVNLPKKVERVTTSTAATPCDGALKGNFDQHYKPANTNIYDSDPSLVASQRNVKQMRLDAFQSRVESIRESFESLSRDFEGKKLASQTAYHNNVAFIEQIENRLKGIIQQVAAQTKEDLLQAFNSNFSRFAQGSFEIQQVLNYLQCTQNDITSNLPQIISDMDVQSLDDIVKQYSQILDAYEVSRYSHFDSQTFQRTTMTHSSAQLNTVNVAEDALRTSIKNLLSVQHQMEGLKETTSISSNNNSSEILSSLIQSRPLPNVDSFSEIPKQPSIYVSFENCDVNLFASNLSDQHHENTSSTSTQQQPSSPQFRKQSNIIHLSYQSSNSMAAADVQFPLEPLDDQVKLQLNFSKKNAVEKSTEIDQQTSSKNQGKFKDFQDQPQRISFAGPLSSPKGSSIEEFNVNALQFFKKDSSTAHIPAFEFPKQDDLSSAYSLKQPMSLQQQQKQKKQNYTDLIEKIALRQSLTDKLCTDLLHGTQSSTSPSITNFTNSFSKQQEDSQNIHPNKSPHMLHKL